MMHLTITSFIYLVLKISPCCWPHKKRMKVMEKEKKMMMAMMKTIRC